MGVIMAAYGGLLLPIIGVGGCFAAMEFLPISPVNTNGIIMIANNIVQSLVTVLCVYLINVDKWIYLAVLLSCSILSIIFGYFVKSNIKSSSKE